MIPNFKEGFDMPQQNIDVAVYKELRKSYEQAYKNNSESFVCNGIEFVTRYAYYYLCNLECNNKQVKQYAQRKKPLLK